MTHSQSLIAEIQMEAANTRKMLQLVPIEKGDFKPHDHSMQLVRLANHIAELPNWLVMTLNTPELNLATMDYKPTMPTTNDELVASFDKNIAEVISALENAKDEDFFQTWTLRNADHIVFSMPKAAVIRSMVLSHMYHHRGQLSVYLRLLDVHVPGMYGPSYNDSQAMKAAQAQHATEPAEA